MSILQKSLKPFCLNLKSGGKKKQNEVETAFLKLEEMTNAEEPGKKKQKRGRKIQPGFQLSSTSFAKYAAELQIEMFSKVSWENCLCLKSHISKCYLKVCLMQ